MALTLVYETHSTTTDNEAGIATGWLPGELSEAGKRQAAELGTRRGNNGIAAIFVSDLKRALDTVAIAFAGTDVPVFVDARLRECNYGELNGSMKSLLDGQRADRLERPWPQGESYIDVVERTRTLLDEIRTQWDRRRVLWVAHSANRWALEHLVNRRPLTEVIARDADWQPGWEYEIR